MAYTLGLDSSTQSLTGTIIDTVQHSLLASVSINFGQELPQYEAQNGYVTNEKNEFLASPLMWLDALELLLVKFQKQGVDLSRIQSIAGTAQQHATVYLNASFPSLLAGLSDSAALSSSLSSQIAPALSRELSPIWMDQTTQQECAEISHEVGAQALHRSTGSLATARFSGPQIRKFSKTQPEAYANTASIHMASSFLCSVLAGKLAPLDLTDASGMNLLDLSTGTWNQQVLDATAADLAEKLPELSASTKPVGSIARYFCDTYGFLPSTTILPWSGDNPASLVGMGGTNQPRLIISLGTSYTVFASMTEPNIDPQGYGHVFANPLGGYMALNCFTNGALTNDTLREAHQLDWAEFNHYAQQPPTEIQPDLNPFVIDEITPPRAANAQLRECSDQPAETIRQVLDHTFLNIKQQSSWIPLPEDTIYVTGGASRSSGICQTIANVFNRKVQLLQSPDSASLGAAMLAAHATGLADIETLSNKLIQRSETYYSPQPESATIYEAFLSR